MSANNQLLVKEHNHRFYIFRCEAESWEGNGIGIKKSLASFPTRKEAHHAAHALDDTEYGVIDEVLAKDGATIVIEEEDS